MSGFLESLPQQHIAAASLREYHKFIVNLKVKASQISKELCLVIAKYYRDMIRDIVGMTRELLTQVDTEILPSVDTVSLSINNEAWFRTGLLFVQARSDLYTVIEAGSRIGECLDIGQALSVASEELETVNTLNAKYLKRESDRPLGMAGSEKNTETIRLIAAIVDLLITLTYQPSIHARGSRGLYRAVKIVL